MATFTRANAFNNGGTFDNTDLLWYAKGVGAMQARALNDPASWWFFGAIHGEELATGGWAAISPPPAVPTAPVPSQSVVNQFWDQCQHQTWFFLPWHRGYLIALEAQVRADVISLGGPATWALPYWNCFGPGQANIPPAFTQQNLPDGSPNPLFVAARFGPNNDGNIFVPIGGQVGVTQNAMSNDVFTGNDAATPPPGFGGPTTGFSHGGDNSGNLENDPHNMEHVFVGGSTPDGTPGLMSDPGLAALDPIFYLHHSNIDRMWAAWNANPANTNPTDPNWLNGPAAQGEQAFVVPMPGGNSMVYTPQQMTSLSQLNYTYDSLPAVAPAPAMLADRLTRLGAHAAAARVMGGTAVIPGKNLELVGANQAAVPIKGVGARTAVKLDTGVRRKVSASLTRASESAVPDRVFLHLENIRGTHDASVLSVYINLPEGARPEDHPELLAGTVGLFGLRRASQKDAKHSGQGLSFVLEITKIVDALHLSHALEADSLDVRIVPHQAVPDQKEITVGRVSVYRQGH